MASDGYISSGDTLIETEYKKVHKLKDGSIMGFAGNGYNWQPVMDYFNSDSKKKKWPHITGSSSIIHLQTDGSILVYDNEGRCFQRTAPAAIGSGWQFALGAMDAGFTPQEAVAVAIGRDLASGGAIFVEELDEDIQSLAA
jgi:ATP-dependent HslUV protease subunit HslV